MPTIRQVLSGHAAFVHYYCPERQTRLCKDSNGVDTSDAERVTCPVCLIGLEIDNENATEYARWERREER